MSVIFIGAIIVVIGGIVGAIGTFMHNKKSSEKTDRIEGGVKENLAIGTNTKEEILLLKKQNNELTISSNQLNIEISTQSNVIDDLRKENTKLYKQLASLSQNIYNNVTGGDSYCEVEVMSIQNNGKTIHFLGIMNKGNYPLENVTIELIQTNKIKQKKRTDNRATLQDLAEKDIIHIGNLIPHGTNGLNRTLELVEGEIFELGIPITTKNTFMSQSLKIVKIGEKVFTASKVAINGSVGQKMKILSDKADVGFPNEKNGKIDWN